MATHYNNFYEDDRGQKWVDPCGRYIEEAGQCITCKKETHRLDTCLEEFYCGLPRCIAILTEHLEEIEDRYGKHEHG